MIRVRLLTDVEGVGFQNEQVGLSDTVAMALITERKAIDVASCASNAKEGAIAHPLWQAQDAAQAAESKSAKPDRKTAQPGADD